jgi:hypothetical protein
VGNWQRRRAGDGGSNAPDAAASGLTPADARAALALRIQRVAEREMDAVERILDVLGPSDHAEADRCARALAVIARTLREITALNTPEDVTRADDTDSDAIPVDLDALRCELARRIKGLIEAERAAGGGDRDTPAVGSAERGS